MSAPSKFDRDRFAAKKGRPIDDLIYDWNPPRGGGPVGVVDESLRDGLQGGVPRLPTTGERLDLMRRASALGIPEMPIGFPAHAEAFEQVADLCRRLEATL